MRSVLAFAFALAAMTAARAAAEAALPSVRLVSHNQVCAPGSALKLDDYALLHFSAQVDESSKAGKKGDVLQNSNDVGTPIVLHFKKDEILEGWLQGLVGVACEGSELDLVVPPHVGFGDDLTILFHIHLLSVSSEPIPEPSLFAVLDADQDGQISLTEFEQYFKKNRKMDLGEQGQAPMGLFFKDDVNQNKHLSWLEFSGPKGTEPPTLAQAIIDRELADPELTKFKKGDPLQADLKLDLSQKPIHTEQQLNDDVMQAIEQEAKGLFHSDGVEPAPAAVDQ